ncbi:NADP-dependent oxidoreductase domain-containing protein [Mycena floridula]|nr:NADP-dependent oxidoreductase domain-containing protein [Mycena floridula]
MATIALKGTGQKMPLVGFGLWKVPRASCAEIVYEAIKAGYRLFDGAGDYGNEKEAGQGVKKALSEGIVKREELFITSKLWNTFHSEKVVKETAKMQLGLWGIDYFDLFLVHFPISLEYVEPSYRYPPEWFGDDGKVHTINVPMQETWTCMEQLVDEGIAKNIGISNCQGSLILDMLRYARIPPQVLQVELHPYLTQESLVDLCKTLGLTMTAYSSFGPQGWIELGMDKGMGSLFTQDFVVAAANKYQKTPAQILLRWASQRGIAVVPKSNDKQRLIENLDSEFEMDEADIKQISTLNCNLRLNNPAEIDPRLAIFA